MHNRYRQPGGEDVAVDAEAAVLRAAGHRVSTYAVANPDGWQAAGPLLVAPWNPTSARRVVAAADGLGVDVVHVHNTWFRLTPSVVAALGRHGYPIVMTLHNYRLFCANAALYRDGHPCQDCVGTHPFHAVHHGCYRGSRLQSSPAALAIALHRSTETWTRHVDVFLALSEFGRNLFVRGGLPSSKITVKPHFVAAADNRAAPPSASDVVLCVGRLDRAKGVDVLIEAFNDRADDRLRLVVIGAGDDAARLQALAGPRVDFLGHLPRADVLAWLRRARALAFPTLMYETFGITMVEAMAAGTPVLASNLGGTSEIIGGNAGLLVSAGDVAAWSLALARLGDPDWVDAAGAAGRARWAANFSPDKGVRALEGAYQAALARAGRETG